MLTCKISTGNKIKNDRDTKPHYRDLGVHYSVFQSTVSSESDVQCVSEACQLNVCNPVVNGLLNLTKENNEVKIDVNHITMGI